jgi:hypothetical protein
MKRWRRWRGRRWGGGNDGRREFTMTFILLDHLIQLNFCLAHEGGRCHGAGKQERVIAASQLAVVPRSSSEHAASPCLLVLFLWGLEVGAQFWEFLEKEKAAAGGAHLSTSVSSRVAPN